jgi:hypothetical protein
MAWAFGRVQKAAGISCSRAARTSLKDFNQPMNTIGDISNAIGTLSN